jgi:hypothetical protein
MDKGIIIGAEYEAATRPTLPVVLFRHSTSVSFHLETSLLACAYHVFVCRCLVPSLPTPHPPRAPQRGPDQRRSEAREPVPHPRLLRTRP